MVLNQYLFFSRAPEGGTILKQGGSGKRERAFRRCGGAAVLRARVGAAQVEVPGDFAIGVREMGVWEGTVTAMASRKRL